MRIHICQPPLNDSITIIGGTRVFVCALAPILTSIITPALCSCIYRDIPLSAGFRAQKTPDADQVGNAFSQGNLIFVKVLANVAEKHSQKRYSSWSSLWLTRKSSFVRPRAKKPCAVRVMLGPKSKSVLIQKASGTPIVCNDGVTIAKGADLADPEENFGA